MMRFRVRRSLRGPTRIPRGFRDMAFSSARRVITMAVLLLCVWAGAAGAAERGKTNFLLLVGDDLCWRDLGFTGNKQVKTPNLDRLRTQGMQLTGMFTPAPTCSPTRHALYTGLHGVRSGAYPNHTRVYDGTKSVFTHLKAHGYRAALHGKNHVGPKDSFPFEILAEANDDNFSKSRDWIMKDPSKPWMLVFASNDPHSPWDRGDPKQFDPASITLPWYLHDNPETRRNFANYYAEISKLDWQVGEMLRMLDSTGQAENTLVMFVSEQGNSFPMGGKWTLYDNGIRAAALVRWPGKVKPGSVSDALMQYTDVTPTILEAAGIDPLAIDTGCPDAMGRKGFDGMSFLSVLSGKSTKFREVVFGQHTNVGISGYKDPYPIRCARDGRFKYIRNLAPENTFEIGGFGKTLKSWSKDAKDNPSLARMIDRVAHRPAEELYDLQADPRELENLVKDPRHGPTLARLRAELDGWMAQQGDKGMATEMVAHTRLGHERTSASKAERNDPSKREPAPSPPKPSAKSPAKPNVLFIAVDDLRPDIGCYGNTIAKTPNLDRLAARGIVFNRAYCQQAVCSPSRSSLLTGRRPDATKVWDLNTHFRSALPDTVTLPQHFKANGYHTAALGKIYHKGYEDGRSWSEPHWYSTGQTVDTDPADWRKRVIQKTGNGVVEYAEGKPEKDEATGKAKGPAYEVSPKADDDLPDGRTAAEAVSRIAKLSRQDKPFFLAVGFLKPHLPFVAPKKYWDMHDPAKIPGPSIATLPKGAPAFAGHDNGEIHGYQGVPKGNPIPEAFARTLRHGYYACVSYTDAQVGRLLDSLDREGIAANTVVVLWGDHGWQLGDHGLWHKHTNFEQAARAPLLLSVPGKATAGSKCETPVEFVDIYPTLAEACRLPAPAGVDGKSLVRLVDNPTGAWDRVAISQYPRAGGKVGAGGPVMGYSIRDERWRLTVWRGKKNGNIVATELYDEKNDPAETVNLAEKPENKPVIEKLSRHLPAVR
jgi:choline-sulfatase